MLVGHFTSPAVSPPKPTHNDNRIENLRILCPNCHTQTPTYCGANKNRKIYLCSCGHPKIKYSKMCSECFKKANRYKINWPNREQFKSMLWDRPSIEIAEALGVSDSAVGRHAKKLNLIKPPRGYWQKFKRSA